MAILGRSLVITKSISPLFSRTFSSSFSSTSFSLSRLSRSSTLLRLRPLTALVELPSHSVSVGLRCFSTRRTTSSLNDPSPNWSNRPPKETILLDGCDFEHWLVVMEPPEGLTRDEIIDSYIKTLAQVVGSEEEARMKIYSVSTRHYFAFGALVSEELSLKIKELPKVRWVLPDSYLDVQRKDYGGEPFIDGKAVPYDPKYHEEWVRNNARANERSRRNDRPRNFDRSRNFERRRENMQNREFQSRDGPPMPNIPNSAPSGGYSNSPPSGGPGGYSPPPPPGGPGGYSSPPPPGGPGGYPSPPPPGGPGGYPSPPPPGGPGGYSSPPPPGGPGGYSSPPPPRGPGGYSNAPPSGGPSGYSNMPPSSGPGGYSNMPPSSGPGGYSNMPPSGGPGGYSNMPNSSGPGGGYSTSRPSGGYSNMPNSSGPSGGYSNMPNNSGPSGGFSSLPNRDYQSSSVPIGDMESASSGNAYQGRDVPGRDY